MGYSDIPKETRREAYENTMLTAETRRADIYKRLVETGPMTADTLMAAMGFMNPNSVRPRLTELCESGLIRPIGKVRNLAGRSVTLWEAIIQDKKSAAPGAGTPKTA